MAGLGVQITPVRSGKLWVNIAGPVNCSTAASVNCNLRIGTGTPPVNGAAPAGSAFGNGVLVTSAASGWFSLTFTGLTTGTPGTTYWLDISVASTSGTITFSTIIVQVFELP